MEDALELAGISVGLHVGCYEGSQDNAGHRAACSRSAYRAIHIGL